MAGATRDRILAEATRRFAAQGIKATTVAQIEEAVGLRKGSGASTYFATKDDLVRGVLEAQLTRSASESTGPIDWKRPTPDEVRPFSHSSAGSCWRRPTRTAMSR